MVEFGFTNVIRLDQRCVRPRWKRRPVPVKNAGSGHNLFRPAARRIDDKATDSGEIVVTKYIPDDVCVHRRNIAPRGELRLNQWT